MNKTRVIKGSNIPSINLSKEIVTILSRLDAEEVKEIIVGIRDYVYKDKESIVNEEITDIMDMVLDNINFIAKGYLNGKKGGRPKKSTLQEVKSTEFDTPQIEENVENENKADLSPSKPLVDNLYHPEGESASNGLKIGKNEVIKDNNENNIEDMGNLLAFNQATGKYEYPNKTKEEIKEKVIKNSLPTVHIAATAQTPSIPTFEEVLKDEKDTIEDIIKDFNAGGMKSRLQAPTRLNELLNRKWGRYYKEQITEYINNRRVA